MNKTDRRQIAPLLTPFYPTMKDATSDEWHGFLNAETGLDISLDEQNASAFDRWRQALAAKNVPVWGYTAEKIANIKARGAELKAKEDERKANMPKLLEQLAVEAPNVTAKQLSDAAAKATKI